MKPRNWVRLVLCFLIFTTLLQIAGLVSPLWIYLEADEGTVGVGLYYRIGCQASSGSSCPALDGAYVIPFEYHTEATYDKDGWIAVVWLETISAGLAVILCIMMMVYAVGFGVWKKMSNLNSAMVITCIFSWLPLIAGLIVYCVFYGKVISRSPDISSVSFPWSALMCFFAAIFLIIITILIHMRCRYRNYVKNAIPTSADSKMQLNPSTKNQVLKRYFTPSPYREERRQALTSSAYYTDQSALLPDGYGAVEYMGYENRATLAPSSRAIEYNVAETREDLPNRFLDLPNTNIISASNNRVVTNTLSAGTYAGVGSTTTGGAVNEDFKGTVFERDLGSSVRPGGAGGTQVIERTYVTRTAGGDEGGAAYSSVYRQGQDGGQERRSTTTTERVVERRMNKRQDSDFDALSDNERVIGKQVNLHRNNDYDAFSDLEAETIYYTGKEGYVSSGLGERESKYTRVIQNDDSRSAGTSGLEVRREVLQSHPPPPPAPPLPQEQVIREITVIEKETSNAERRHFRVPADVSAADGAKHASHYTVHTRFTPDDADYSGLNLAPGLLNGDKFRYNGAYIYRPYSEEAY